MRRPLALLLVTVLSLAGCLGPDPTDAAAVDDLLPDLPGTVARVVSVVDERGGMGEPSLGVAPDGTLYTNGRDHDRAAGPDSGAVYRSTDGGATWAFVAAPAAPFPNLDPDLAVDVDGTLWYDILYLGCNVVSVSRDGGATWTTNPAVCNGPVGDRQYVIPTKGGTAYLYYHQLPTFQQTAKKTTDYGLTWTPLPPTEPVGGHLLLDEGSGWGGGGFWNPVTDSVFFTYTWNRGGLVGEGGWSPAASVTRDGGLTWELVTVANAGGRAHGLSLVVGAADAAGNVYLAWSETTDDDSGVYFASSADDGATWSAPKRVDRGNASNVFPAITAGPAGEVAIAYYESDESGYPSDVSDEASWNVTLAWTGDALAEAPTFAYGQLSTHTVKRGPICPDGTTCDGNRQLLDYFSAKRLPDGRVAAVWASTEDVEGVTVNVVGVTDATVLG
jgi:hypothetical protein